MLSTYSDSVRLRIGCAKDRTGGLRCTAQRPLVREMARFQDESLNKQSEHPASDDPIKYTGNVLCERSIRSAPTSWPATSLPIRPTPRYSLHRNTSPGRRG